MYSVPTKMKVKKLAPSRKPTAFGPGDGAQPEKVQRQQRRLDPGLDDEEADEQRRHPPAWHGLAAAQPTCGGLGDGVDQEQRAPVMETAPKGS